LRADKAGVGYADAFDLKAEEYLARLKEKRK